MNSHLPVGRLADRLESLSRERAWLAIVVATAAITLADKYIPGVGFGPLYIPVVCAACWALGASAGYLVAVVTGIMTAVMAARHGEFVPGLMLLKMAIRVGTYVFIAATINSFRKSFDRERYLSHRDRMTGALNKEIFHQRAAQEIEAANRVGAPLLLAILDLDDFKAVNSEHGHAAGDEVLRTFARAAAATMRREDHFGRIGGDEFALVLRVPSAADGHASAYMLHGRLSSLLADSPYPVTISMGALVVPPQEGRTEAELMRSVDALMYRVKGAGKNAILVERADGASSSQTDNQPAQWVREQIA